VEVGVAQAGHEDRSREPLLGERCGTKVARSPDGFYAMAGDEDGVAKDSGVVAYGVGDDEAAEHAAEATGRADD
jgi:hypothetical protein